MTGGGSTGRLVGFVVMGAAIGAAVSLVEEFGKEFWLVGMSGPKEGRSIILAKPLTILGRDERADVPLFGDVTVQPQHALLRQEAGGMTLLAAPGQAVTVNQQMVAEVPLSDGDIVGIGRHRFRFRARRAAHPITYSPPMPASPETLIYRQQAAPPPAVLPGTPFAMPIGGQEISRLEVLSGPHAGEVYPLTPGAILGRDPRCDIALLRDNTISRQHLRFVRDVDGWRLEDGGSANGTFVNGQRVAVQPLAPGDQVSIGATLLHVV
jgi:pSer/pThr/pTyr-binding forkhead associated (FHA) protein